MFRGFVDRLSGLVFVLFCYSLGSVSSCCSVIVPYQCGVNLPVLLNLDGMQHLWITLHVLHMMMTDHMVSSDHVLLLLLFCMELSLSANCYALEH